MATALQKETKKTIAQLTAGEWGLMLCMSRHKCKFCQLYQEETDRDTRRQYRNLYISGFPPDLIPKLLDGNADLCREDVHTHAWRQGWHNKKKEAPLFKFDEAFISELIARRMMKSWDVISESTGDKMIEAAMKLAGVGQKVEVSGNVAITWEKIAAKANTSEEDATIILEDGEFSEVDVPQIEEAIAETD